ncbi:MULTISPECIES: toll/interleukin-1 receptor domain-containing protein [unclassified Burkholderia]|uniref:toll/interleukin-1 receptor domain-containing protein n=1 Tax=unclassified Burkholderia TaxID=2613784 RepID=UPI0015C5975B|nr:MULTISPECIES: toll/interleukin-1 receptor domain-containing protein [unclassified Burkholderia]MDN7429919.1 toll/interleukin-1 receptor domain-containing protein [Burkholderia sp. AU45388]
MYRGFNLKIQNGNPFGTYKDRGKALFDTDSGRMRPEITRYVKDDAIDATQLQADWFGAENAEVFISHSHRDVDLALSLAGWLDAKFGLRAFIDSTVWGYSDDLLKQIDNAHCKNDDEKTYSYEARNRSTSHVHMMLSCALSTMIDRAECIIFLNTPSSIVVKESIDDAGASLTASPWIYAELTTSKLIRKRMPSRVVLESIEKSGRERIIADSATPFHYEVELSHLANLNHNDLIRWQNAERRGTDALDALYAFKPQPNEA